jgi:hypothetical protein
MSETIYFDGDNSAFYELNLKEETLNAAKVSGGSVAESIDASLYYGRYYLQFWDLETGVGSLKHHLADNEYEVVVEDMQIGPIFANGNVYYSKADDRRIYYRSLQNSNYRTEEVLSDDIQKGKDSFLVCGNMIIYNRSEDVKQTDIVAVDIITGQLLASLDAFSMGSVINVSEKFIYYFDRENTLQSCNYMGEVVSIFSNVDKVRIEMVNEEWVYFRYSSPDDTNYNALLGKVKLDGTSMMGFT